MQHMVDCAEIPAWVNGALEPVDKIEVHRRGLLHKAVSVFVLCKGELLIQRRAMGKYHTPGLWANTCCTHPHWNESAETCAQRRLDEELGLRGLALEPREQITYRADVGGGMVENEQVDIFVAQVDHRPVMAPNPAEVMDTRWEDVDSLILQTRDRPDQFTPWIRLYLSDHADRIFGV